MPDLATHFNLILAGLRALLADRAARRRLAGPWLPWMLPAQDHAHTPLLTEAWYRLQRMARRFESLYHRWQQGSPLQPRPRIKPRAAKAPLPEGHIPPPRPPSAPTMRLPQRWHWLSGYVIEANIYACNLEVLLSRPEMDEFLAAAPQVGRILRPLCHMLGLDPPQPSLRRTKRVRTPKPRVPRPKPPPYNIPLKRPRLPDIWVLRKISPA